jgi:hypothetical protein
MAMLNDMAAQIEHNSPPSALAVSWRYK